MKPIIPSLPIREVTEPVTAEKINETGKDLVNAINNVLLSIYALQERVDVLEKKIKDGDINIPSLP
jgi:hypothetical protein